MYSVCYLTANVCVCWGCAGVGGDIILLSSMLPTEFDTEGLAPTDQQLSALANEFEIQSKWYDIGCALGVAKTTLDRIESELENNKGKTRAAFEMLHMAREKPSFSSSAELARKLYTIGIRCDLYWLRGCQNK